MSSDENDETNSATPSEGGRERVRGMIVIGRSAVSDADGLIPEHVDLVRRIQESLERAFDAPGERFVEDLLALVRENKFEEAAQLLHEGDDAWFAIRVAGRSLLDAALMIPLESLPHDLRLGFCRTRAAIACEIGDFVRAMPDVEWLLAEGSASERWRFRWDFARAMAARQEGHRELALRRLWMLASGSNASVTAEDRAYLLTQLVETLPEGEPEAAALFAEARDLYLIAGRRREAARHHVRQARRLQLSEPNRALSLLQTARSLLVEDDPESRGLKAWSSHLTARILAERGRWVDASVASNEAVTGLRSLIGRERQLVEALGIRAEIERRLVDSDAAQAYHNEAMELASRLNDNWLLAKHRLASTRDESDDAALKVLNELHGEPASCGEAFWRHFLRAQYTKDVDLALSHAESALKLVSTCAEARDNEHLVHWRIAKSLQDGGSPGRAIERYRHAFALSPWVFAIRDHLLQLLWNEKRWEDAASLLQGEIARLGELPGLLVAWGRSLLEAGQAQGAADALAKALRVGGPNTQAQELLLLACSRGALPAVVTAPSVAVRSISLDHVRETIEAFGRLVSGNQRMSFWKLGGQRRHSWRSSPEELAKQLLLTALGTAYGDQIEILDETKAGAGRIDLYARFGHSTRIVIELKMCGAGYSEGYALQGLEQLAHYMEARGTQLGVLVVFDGRTRDFGKGFTSMTTLGTKTVLAHAIDVRPTVRALG